MPAIQRSEFALALNQVATERGIDPDIVLDTIKAAILAAYRKDYGTEEIEELEITIDPQSGEAKVFKDKKDITPAGFGRIAAQTAKQVILQRIREAEKKAIDLALLVGEEKEEGEWGKWSTGISSYGDRAANFGGFVFWRDVIDSGNPIIKCKNGKWEIARKFNFSDYVTDGWDEAINCSSYQDAKFAKVVDDALAVLSINSGNKISCPINKESCLVLKAIYGVYAEKILHPKCYAVEAGIILDIEKQKLSSGLEGGGDSPMINESKRDNKGFRNDIEKSNGSSQEIFWK